MAARKRTIRLADDRTRVRVLELIETITQTDAQLRLNFKIHRKAWAELRPLLKTVMVRGNENGPGSSSETEAGNGARSERPG